MINFKTIIHKVSNKTNVPLYKVHKVISLTFKEIDRLIRKKENILLRGFMKFVTSKRSDYKKPNKLSINQIVKFPNKPKQ
tara:strand:+ start:51 stop:290 length:240 start_codon:yes stop_codon:yes gene_type:complete